MAKSTALVAPVENFLEAAGHDELMEALEFSPKERLQALRAAMLDPKPGSSFKRNCAKYEVNLTDLVECCSDLQRARGVVAMLKHLPQVMEDVAIDAKSQTVYCQKCDGGGVIFVKDSDPKQCPQCKGKKEVRVPGDKDARNLVFEASNLKGRQAKVQIQQNFGSPSVEDSINMVQKILVP